MTNVLIVPEVISDNVTLKINKNMKFKDFANISNELEGKPGEVLKFPFMKYIGDAAEIAIGEEVKSVNFEMGSTSATVKHIGLSVDVHDAELTKNVGNTIEGLEKQLANAITQGIDAGLYAAFDSTPLVLDESANTHLTKEVIGDALALFGEDVDGEKYIFVSAQQAAQLRKDPDFIAASKMQEHPIALGRDLIGDIWGATVVISRRVKAENGKIVNFIAKPGALGLELRKDVHVEAQRAAKFLRTDLVASAMFAAYLADESAAVKLIVSATPVTPAE